MTRTRLEPVWLTRVLTTAAALTLLTPAAAVPAQAAGVDIPDPVFRACLSHHLSQPSNDPITAAELAGLEDVDCQPWRWDDDGFQIRDITGAEHLTGLTALSIAENQVSDLTPLEGLIDLEYLAVNSNEALVDIAPLADLTNLSILDLFGNDITDVEPLRDMVQLEELYIAATPAGAGVSDISPLAGLTRLTTLMIAQGTFSDLTPLSNMKDLADLTLCGCAAPNGGNNVSDLTPLADLPNLKYLFLDDNRITDASPMAHAVAERGLHVLAEYQNHDVEATVGETVRMPTVKDTRAQTVAPLSCTGPSGPCLTSLVSDGGTPAFTAPAAGEYVIEYDGEDYDHFSLTLTITATVAETPVDPTDPVDPIGPIQEFTDVTEDHNFFDEITWLAGENITTGYADGSFGPGLHITRGQMAAFLYRMAGEPEFTVPAVSPFQDVETTDSFYRAIAWMGERDITTGYANGSYGPVDTVTRGQMAAFIHRHAGSPAVTTGSDFADVPDGSTFDTPISWLVQEEITLGYASGAYGTHDAVTRGQMAAFLYRFHH